MNIKTTVFLAMSLACSSAQGKLYKIYINQFVRHPALDVTVKGIQEELTRLGYIDNQNAKILLECAQGNTSLVHQISSKFAHQGADVIVGVATLSAQSAFRYASYGKISLVFSSVTAPVEAKLVKSLENPGNNTTGVSNFVPLEPQLEWFKSLYPPLKTLGFLYNPAEANSCILVKKLSAVCPQYGITLVPFAIKSTSEVSSATTALVQKVDSIFISNDSTALSALKVIIKIAHNTKVPVFVSDIDAVALGAFAGKGPDQYQIGVRTARIVDKVLKGKNAGTIPVEFPEDSKIYINTDAMKLLGIEVPKEILEQAELVTSS